MEYCEYITRKDHCKKQATHVIQVGKNKPFNVCEQHGRITKNDFEAVGMRVTLTPISANKGGDTYTGEHRDHQGPPFD